MAAAKNSMSGRVSQSAVMPKAMVPARLVHAMDSPMFSAMGITGY
jgi:hypothetical protein